MCLAFSASSSTAGADLCLKLGDDSASDWERERGRSSCSPRTATLSIRATRTSMASSSPDLHRLARDGELSLVIDALGLPRKLLTPHPPIGRPDQPPDHGSKG